MIARALALALAASACLMAGGCSRADPSGLEAPVHGRIVSVADGDTITVRLDTGERRRVRLLAIDSPEKYPTRYEGPEECGSLAASAFMERFTGREVVLVSDPSQDALDGYGRLLRYVQLQDGIDLGASVLARGLAMPYVFAVPAHRSGRYRDLAERARAVGRGSWGAPCGGDFHSSLPGVQDGL